MKLYGMYEAGSLIAEFIIEEMGLSCALVYPSDEARDEPEFRALSPYGRIPVLLTEDGEVIFESIAIVLYLLEQNPNHHLAPERGAPGRSRFLSWLAYLATTLYDAHLRLHHSERYGEGKSVQNKARQEIITIYDHIEAQPGLFMAGDKMTAADFYLYMLVWWDDDAQVYLSQRPKLKAIIDKVGAKPSVKAVMARQKPSA